MNPSLAIKTKQGHNYITLHRIILQHNKYEKSNLILQFSNSHSEWKYAERNNNSCMYTTDEK